MQYQAIQMTNSLNVEVNMDRLPRMVSGTGMVNIMYFLYI